MASAGAIRAGEAFVEISAKDAALSKALAQWQTKLSAWGNSIQAIGLRVGALGALAVGGFGAALKSFIDTGSALADTSARTGTSVEALTELEFAARMAGDNLEGVEHALRHMQRTLVEAADGGQQAVGALADLGLAAADLRGLAPEEQIGRIGERLGGLGDAAQRSATAMAIFGRGGGRALAWATSLGESRRRAQELGLVISTDMVSAADRLRGAFETLKLVGRRTLFGIGEALAPVLSPLAEGLARVGAGMNAWISANPELVRGALGIAGAVAGVGGAALATSVGLRVFSFALSGPLSILRGLGAVSQFAFGAIASGAGTAASVLGAVVNPLRLIGGLGRVLAPVGQIVRLLAGGLGGGLGALAGIGSVFGSLASGLVLVVKAAATLGLLLAGGAALGSLFAMAGGAALLSSAFDTASRAATGAWNMIIRGATEARRVFGSVGSFIADTWRGIMDALMAGDFQLAGQVGMASLRLGWLETIRYMQDRWQQFSAWFSNTFGMSLDGLWVRIRTGFVQTIAFIQRQIARLTTGWDYFVNWFTGGTPQPGTGTSPGWSMFGAWTAPSTAIGQAGAGATAAFNTMTNGAWWNPLTPFMMPFNATMTALGLRPGGGTGAIGQAGAGATAAFNTMTNGAWWNPLTPFMMPFNATMTALGLRPGGGTGGVGGIAQTIENALNSTSPDVAAANTAQAGGAAAAATTAIQSQLVTTLQQIEADLQASIASITASSPATQAATIIGGLAGGLGGIGNLGALTNLPGAGIPSRDAEIERTRRERQDLLDQARRARLDVEQRQRDRLAAESDAIGKQEKSVGTFSSVAASGISGSGVLNQILAEDRDAVTALRQILGLAGGPILNAIQGAVQAGFA